MLQIVDAGSGTASGGATEPWLENAPASAGGGADSDEEDEVDASYLIREEEPAGEAPPPTPTVRPSPRRTKKVSPIKSLLQIVGGGLVSIPLALLILLLLKYLGVANPNLGFWPLDGRPLQGRVTAVPPPSLPTRPSSSAPEPGGRLLGESMPDFGEMDPAADLDEMLESADNAPADNAPADNVMNENAPPENAPPENAPPENAPTENAPTENAPPENAPTAEASPDETTPLDDGPAAEATPTMEAANAPSLIEVAQQASRDLAAHEDAATRPRVVKDLYLALAQLAATEPTGAAPRYGELFDQLRERKQLATMGRFGQPWLATPRRVHEGLFAVGSIVEQEAGYALQWEDGQTVTISDGEALSGDPADFLGKPVVLLAKIDTAAEPPRLQLRYLERFDLASPEPTQP
jgi:hypothetical protein